jgi:hypothetical protein
MTYWLIFFVPAWLLVGWCWAILHRVRWPDGGFLHTILWLMAWPLMAIGWGILNFYDKFDSWGPTDAVAHRIRQLKKKGKA